MLFKNLILYRLPENWSVPVAELEEALGRRPLQPCSGFDMQTRGFVACGHDERLLYTQGKHRLLALGVNRKLLPASVVNQQAKERAVELAAQQGYPVGRRQMRELKARITDELRARALTSRRTTYAWLNIEQGWLAVNTTSASRAEELVETLRETLGSFAALPVASLNSPAGAMATWLTQGRVPGRFSIDQDLELQAVDGGGAIIRYVNHPLDSAEIRSHLGTGKTPTRLGLVWNERIAFMLQQNLYIKRIRFLDVYKDDNAQGENPQEQFDIDFALMTGELSQLLEEMFSALGGEETAPVRQAA